MGILTYNLKNINFYIWYVLSVNVNFLYKSVGFVISNILKYEESVSRIVKCDIYGLIRLNSYLELRSTSLFVCLSANYRTLPVELSSSSYHVIYLSLQIAADSFKINFKNTLFMNLRL